MTKAVFQLESLTCPSCIKKIETTLTKTEGVQLVRVMFHTSKVKTEFDNTRMDAGQLKEVIQKLGYPVLYVKESL